MLRVVDEAAVEETVSVMRFRIERRGCVVRPRRKSKDRLEP